MRDGADVTRSVPRVKYDLTKVSHDVLDRLLAIADGSNMKDKFWTNRTYTFRELVHTHAERLRARPQERPLHLRRAILSARHAKLRTSRRATC